MFDLVSIAIGHLRARWKYLRSDDTGATAIEWAVFAVLAILIAGLVAAAITAYVKAEDKKIK
jgi:Flp pilus assembly pilin Flp